MPYTTHTTAIEGALMLEPRVFGDARGFFFESFNARDFAAAGASPLLPWLARYLPPAPAAALGRLLGDGGPPPKIQYAPYDWESNDGTS